MMFDKGDRVYMLKGPNAGTLGTVIAVDESSEVPMLIEPDDPAMPRQWSTSEEVTEPHPSRKSWHRTHYRP